MMVNRHLTRTKSTPTAERSCRRAPWQGVMFSEHRVELDV